MTSPMSDITNGLSLDEAQLKALEELKAKVQEEQPDINLGPDDRIYLRYLHACNFNVQKAYDRVSR